ncbi:MAG: Crp/Fnr family transcriptional regulator, partial [Chloroflexota bacterium]
VTLEETAVVWMDRATFQESLQAIPPMTLNLVRILSARVRLSNELIQALATLDVYGRVARQLLAFAERYGETCANGSTSIPIRLTQGDIADLVGASRKRVNQVMVAFKQQNYIAVNNNGRITVIDRLALAKFCR